jgi:hypothetical protein
MGMYNQGRSVLNTWVFQGLNVGGCKEVRMYHMGGRNAYGRNLRECNARGRIILVPRSLLRPYGSFPFPCPSPGLRASSSLIPDSNPSLSLVQYLPCAGARSPERDLL